MLESKMVDLFPLISLLLFKVFPIFTLTFLSLFFSNFYLELSKEGTGWHYMWLSQSLPFSHAYHSYDHNVMWHSRIVIYYKEDDNFIYINL